MDVKRRGAGIAKAVLAWGAGDDQRLAGRDDLALLVQPHLGFAIAHRQHFLDGVRMGRRAVARRYPLLEDGRVARRR